MEVVNATGDINARRVAGSAVVVGLQCLGFGFGVVARESLESAIS